MTGGSRASEGLTDAEYTRLAERLAAAVRAVVPADAAVLVVGRGDQDLVGRLGPAAAHFPGAADGSWSGWYPQDDVAAIAHLEALRAHGAQFLLLPRTSEWWLEHYPVFASHLASRYPEVAAIGTDGVLLSLEAALPAPWTDALDAVVTRLQLRLGRPPVILDWDSGLELAGHVHGVALARRRQGTTLPDLDGTADAVVLRGGTAERLRDARRVAPTVIEAATDAGRRVLKTGSRRRRADGPAAPVVLVDGRTTGLPAAGVLRALRETCSGEVVVMLDTGVDDPPEPSPPGLRLLPVDHGAGLADVIRMAGLEPAADAVALLAPGVIPLAGWWRAALRCLAAYPSGAAISARQLTSSGERLRPAPDTALDPSRADLVLPDPGPGGLLVVRRGALHAAAALAPSPATDAPGDVVSDLVRRLGVLGHTIVEDPAVRAVRLARWRPDDDAPAVPVRTPSGTRDALVLCERLDHDAELGRGRIVELAATLADGGWQVVLLAELAGPRTRLAQELADLGIEVLAAGASHQDERILAAGFRLVVLQDWRLAERRLPAIRAAPPGAHVVVDCPQLDLRADAQRALAPRAAGAVALPLDDEYADSATAELNAYAAADAVLTADRRDATLIRALCSDDDLAHVVAPSAPPQRAAGPGRRRGLLAVVDVTSGPDLVALEWLWDEVLPRLDHDMLREHPLHLVGADVERYLPPDAAATPGVRLVGEVASLPPWLRRARLLLGSGAVTAQARQLAASANAAGLPVLDDETDPDAYADAILDLLQDPVRWRRHAAAGRRAARGHDAGTAVAAALSATLAGEPKRSLLAPVDTTQANRRAIHVANQRAIGPLRALLRRLVPQQEPVLVVNDGDSELLRLHPRPAMPFPQNANGGHREFTPNDANELLAHLEAVRAAGARHLLVPHQQRWWLDYYPELGEHLRSDHDVLLDDDHGLLVSLRPPCVTAPSRPASDGSPAARLVAFYLPQFHPIPENDAWWGPGFTEWTKVAQADPLFAGHEQPSLPGELGFYDLRLPEIRSAQARLAREHGIHGFCYYHYWFGGRRLLERPFDEVLAAGEPDLPFCLCWANEPWSRRWDGSAEELLQAQSYSAQDDLDHIRWLLPALADPRAITVEGCPAFLVYRPRSLPDPARTVQTWRRAVAAAGLPGIHLVAVQTPRDGGFDARAAGFDATLGFAPQFGHLRALGQVTTGCPDGPRVYDYEQAWRSAPVGRQDGAHYETVCPRWDNTPRAGRRGLVLQGSTPPAYERWLGEAIARASRREPDRRLVFLNAWNEWGEGACLEPDVVHGRAYLEATRRALHEAQGGRGGSRRARAGVVAP